VGEGVGISQCCAAFSFFNAPPLPAAFVTAVACVVCVLTQHLRCINILNDSAGA